MIMFSRTPLAIPCSLVAAFLANLPCGLCAADDNEVNAVAIEFFETSVRPLLLDKCIDCHGPKKQHSGLRMDSMKSMLNGGDSGPAIVPFKPEESLLMEAVRRESFEMPPEEPLTADEVAVLERWIRQGAIWRETGNAAADTVPDFAGHWAFRPVQSPPVPEVRQAAWPRNDIDRFVLHRLEQSGITPSDQAEVGVLARRMKFDLLGLPVSSKEVAGLAGHSSSEQLDAWIDQLLESPHYGERAARHWLDVARFADTKGYVFFEKPDFRFAYTYRDYVINSFNKDKPFDQFVREQLAADLMNPVVPAATQAALGFLTIGPHFKNDIHDIIADRIDVVSRGLMGITISCARCHDHKYDPISIDDYYALYGVFRNSVEPLNLPFRTPQGSEKDVEHREKMVQAAEKLDRLYREQYQKVLQDGRTRLREYLETAQRQREGVDTSGFDIVQDGDDLNPQLIQLWKQYLEDREADGNPVFVAWNRLAALGDTDFDAAANTVLTELAKNSSNTPSSAAVLQRLQASPPTSFADVVETYSSLFLLASPEPGAHPGTKDALSNATDKDQQLLHAVLSGSASPLQAPFHRFKLMRLFPDRESQKTVNKLNAELDKLRGDASVDSAQVLALQDADTMIPSRVFRRGNPARPGKVVARRFPQFFAKESIPEFTNGSGRLQLAEAIVSPDNPLTARVIVNRIWRQHFGTGLVLTPSNFGMQAPPPTHPQLLDHLATWLMDNNWSLKGLHRYIMQSATYRQSSRLRPELLASDPDNRQLYRMNRRRVDFESMRDAVLAVSGQMDFKIGGPSVKGIFDRKNHRRTLYAHINRQDVPGTMRTFDFPPPDVSTGARDETAVPGQTLFLMNHPMIIAAAIQIADGTSEMPDNATRVQHLFRTILGRVAESTELSQALAYLQTADAAVPEAVHIPDQKSVAQQAVADTSKPAGTSSDDSGAEKSSQAPVAVMPIQRLAQILLMSNEFHFVD